MSLVREFVVAPGDTGIVKSLVGEVRADVAGGAVPLPAKNLQALQLQSGEDARFSGRVAIEPRVPGANTSNIAREGACKRRLVELHASGGLGERHVHLVGTLDWMEHLDFEGRRSPVPEERASVSAINRRRRIAMPTPAECPGRDRCVRRKATSGDVAGTASHGAVAGQALVVEQPTPQHDRIAGDRVAVRHGHVEVQPKWGRREGRSRGDQDKTEGGDRIKKVDSHSAPRSIAVACCAIALERSRSCQEFTINPPSSQVVADSGRAAESRCCISQRVSGKIHDQTAFEHAQAVALRAGVTVVRWRFLRCQGRRPSRRARVELVSPIPTT